ncbi:MAG: CPBP family intramembrane metalloprotease [Ruminiclostridium sp.]|nr:CPBP family intramembrane metalloprotease [Ruminiclostridium sp.]
MKYSEGTAGYALRKLSDKYGAVMLFEVFNYVFVGNLLMIICFALFTSLTGVSALNNETDLGFTFFMLMNSVASYAVPLMLYPVLFRSEFRSELPTVPYPKRPFDMPLLFFAGSGLARIGALMTVFVSSVLNLAFGIPKPEAAFSNMMPANLFQFAVFEFFSIIVAPLCEELICRHLLLRPLRAFGDMQAAVVSGMLFGLSHFNFDQFLYTFLFGFSMAVIAIRSNSVKPAIIVHMINNLIAGMSSYRPETFDDPAINAVFSFLGTLCDYLGYVLLFVGFAAFIAAIVLKLFSFRAPSVMTNGEQLRVIFTGPLFIAGVAVSLLFTFFLLYL